MRALTPILVLALAGAVQAQTIQLTPLSSGASPKIGGYRPQRLTLKEEKPGTITKLPADLKSPMFGVLPIGGESSKLHVVLDEPEGAEARIFVDTNGNGDLTDDDAAEWKGREVKGRDGNTYTQYGGGANVAIGGSKSPRHINMYRFDKTDPSRAAMKDIVFYYADYAYEGTMTFGSKTYNVLLVDDMTAGDFRGKQVKEIEGRDGKPAKVPSGIRLLIDVNGSGKFEARGEAYDIREPFNIGGTTYEIADMEPSGARFNLVKSSKTVAEIPPPPDHSVGQKITPFTATMMNGKKVNFPGDYKGKLVMLDFWATWCGPCIGEVPNLVKVYDEHHSQGFEILGITFDNANAEQKIADCTKEHGMTWPHVYDGGGWKTEIGTMYVINSIPAAYLVDGDTGTILATTPQLRGDKLKGTLEKALADKKAKSRS